ncbi:sensor domain-containing diguanylate cyclase [Oceanirhabdus sp. W0125-5]|uniref:sensor domain-containing diguanylate cyclase n=1 Tax=Oceanirhabdus sp. W0125-5 TaxID=2999116 RepID=UPI0022F3462B|nr:sensor domain-containing diguanylate cyclase [Oceanirhabdus sp. W0125-5]WBW98764.1 sensor domain-containing diguanylate cyclase [Oceanirhabdus sp. W0125-5]
MDELHGNNFNYIKIKEEFETYKSFAESTIELLNNKVEVLEKKIDAITNVMEISKYINLNVSESDLIPKINDMIVGILGVEYSTIYIKKDEKFVVEATNISKESFENHQKSYYDILDDRNPFIINCKSHKKSEDDHGENHSIIGVPINFRGTALGYIVVEHSMWGFLSSDHMNFLTTISNHIGIALDNNFLYMTIRESSRRDPLLNIYNRKFFFDQLDKKLSDNSNIKFALVMMDIDDFKKINDRYGHQFGDNVLNNITSVIQDNIGEKDILARYGGEELIVYIDQVGSKAEVYERIEELREKIKENSLYFNGEKVITTMSFGIGFYPYDSENIDGVVSVADKCLYISKRSGKDQVTYRK